MDSIRFGLVFKTLVEGFIQFGLYLSFGVQIRYFHIQVNGSKHEEDIRDALYKN